MSVVPLLCRLRFICLVCLATALPSALAQPVGFTLSGRVRQIYTQPGGVVTSSATFQIGEPYTLTVVYDSRATVNPNINSGSNFRRYRTGAAFFSYRQGAYVGWGSPVGIEVIDSSPVGDYFRISEFAGSDGFPPVDGRNFDRSSTFFLELHNPSGTAFSSPVLPSALRHEDFSSGNTFLALRYGSGQLNVAFTVTAITPLAPGAGPVIAEAPASRDAVLGASTTFQVGALPLPDRGALRYRWQRNGVDVPGATASALTLSPLTAAHAGTYTVSVTHASGDSTASLTAPAVLRVIAPPVISLPPAAQAIAAGETATFQINATDLAATFQWQKNGADLPGATAATLTLENLTPSDAGSYTCTVTNLAGRVTSPPATLVVNYARVANLSVRSLVGPGPQALIVGFVVAGANPKQAVARGVGPTLADFGVPSPAAQPQLALLDARGARFATNQVWGGDAALTLAFSRVGAFALPPTSRDSALVAILQPGAYTAEFAASAPGEALYELFDADLATNLTRFANLSVLADVSRDRPLTVGFVITGNLTKRYLIRAIGPSLGQFGLTGTLPRPQFVLVETQHRTTVTALGWDPGPDLASVTSTVGAFPLLPGATDTAQSYFLPPGSYAVQVTDVNNAAGRILVEFYAAP